MLFSESVAEIFPGLDRAIATEGGMLSSLNGFVVLLLAYASGTFIQSISSTLLNPLYGKVYRPKKEAKHRLLVDTTEAYLRTYAGVQDGVAYVGGDLRDWADFVARVRHPNFGPALDRHEAVSKLFRGICLLLGILIVTAFLSKLFGEEATQRGFSVSLIAGLIYVLLFALSMWRFLQQRWKHQYLSYLICHQLAVGERGGAAAHAAE